MTSGRKTADGYFAGICVPLIAIGANLPDCSCQLNKRCKILCLISNRIVQNKRIISSCKIPFCRRLRFTAGNVLICSAGTNDYRGPFSLHQSFIISVKPCSNAAVFRSFRHKFKNLHDPTPKNRIIDAQSQYCNSVWFLHHYDSRTIAASPMNIPTT